MMHARFRHATGSDSGTSKLTRARLLLTLACAGAALLVPNLAFGQSPDARRWLEDLDALARELPKRHVSPAVERPVDAFRADVEQVRRRVPSLSREAIILEFARLAASFGDSHTEASIAQEGVGFHRFPIGSYFFGTDLRVIVVAPGNEELLGLRLVSIGERSIGDVLDRVEPIIADDFGNPYEILHSGPSYVMIPEVLIGLGLTPPTQPIEYVFESDDGKRVTKSFTPVPLREAAGVMTVRFVSEEAEPLYMRRRDEWYVAARVDASDLLYVRVSRSQDQSGRESLADLASRVGEAAAEPEVRGAVVDLRQNTGGNFHKTERLVSAICRATETDEIERVYVILGRHTYSAAVVLAAQLKQGCGAVFVGEVPRAVPNRQADVGSFRLPISRLEVTYSKRLRKTFPELGDATQLPLEIIAPPNWEDYRAGRDPALESILALRKPNEMR